MPSPPLVPDIAPSEAPIDLEHLRRMTLGDAALEREVLGMFASQATRLVAALAHVAADAGALAHTLKGSARAIGAFRVSDAAGELEQAIRDGDDWSRGLADLRDAVAEARGAIDAILRPS